MTERVNIWWVVQPPGIPMTDGRARALLERRADAKNSDEDIFIQANASTMIPPALKIVPLGENLHLNKPSADGHQDWEDSVQ